MYMAFPCRVRSAVFFVVAGLLAAAGELPGCNVPVFRYALERWPADPYLLTVFHKADSPQSAAPERESLQQASDRGQANFELLSANLDEPLPERQATLWSSQKGASPPWLVIEYPDTGESTPPAWSGKLEPGIARQLLDSPARREIARRLVTGASSVWVLLESGNATADDATEAVLKAELGKLETEIEVPPVDPEDPRTAGNAELKIAFSVLRLSREDPLERIFIATLLGIDPELAGGKGPIGFPVFGRGRVLAGMAGKFLEPEAIREATFYLCGACSCEIKAQNPGFDLLMAVNWEDAIEKKLIQDPELPPLVSLSALVDAAQPPPAAAVSPAPSGAGGGASAESPAADGTLRRNLLTAGGLALIALLWGTVRLLRRKGP